MGPAVPVARQADRVGSYWPGLHVCDQRAGLGGLVAVLDSRQSPDSANIFPFTLGGSAIGRLFRIWPSSSNYGVEWPPSAKITAADFQTLADSLQGLGPPYADVGASTGDHRPVRE